MLDFTRIDPAWAWATYEPKDGLTPRELNHLFRRAGLAATAEQIQAAAGKSAQQVVNELIAPSQSEVRYEQDIESLAQAALATGDCRNLSAWWTYRLLTTPDQLLEKLTLFWHGHFATGADKVTDPRLMFRQNELLRTHALGDFGQLLHEVSRDPAMLIYLDSATNRKAHANENYAREIMELFYLGEGNYTEQDIRELARCFTGWEIRRDEFRFNKYQHDDGSKSVLGQSGRFGGDDGVEIVLAQDAGPQFIAGKLIRFFVIEEPTVPASLISPLAELFRDEQLQVASVIRRILSSNLFFAPEIRGRKVRSPVEYILGLLRGLKASTNNYALASGMGDVGQHLFYPPNVKGWDGGRTWINSSTLLGRANLLREVLDRKETRFDGGSLTELMDKQKLKNSDQIVSWLSETFLAIDLTSDARNQLKKQIDQGSGNREEKLRNAVHLLGTLPEFHVC